MNQKSIKKNMLMSTILTSANFVFPLITYSYVARVLTPAGTGKVAFVNSILSYFSYLAILVIPHLCDLAHTICWNSQDC